MGVGFGTGDGVAAREIQLVGHDAEIADAVALVDGAGGIGSDEHVRAECRHQPHGEGDLLGGIALIAMEPPLHGEHPPAAQHAGHEAPHMPVGRGDAMPGTSPKGTKTGSAMRSARGPSPEPKMRPTSGRKVPEALLHHRLGRIQRPPQVFQSHREYPS